MAEEEVSVVWWRSGLYCGFGIAIQVCVIFVRFLNDWWPSTKHRHTASSCPRNRWRQFRFFVFE